MGICGVIALTRLRSPVTLAGHLQWDSGPSQRRCALDSGRAFSVLSLHSSLFCRHNPSGKSGIIPTLQTRPRETGR